MHDATLAARQRKATFGRSGLFFSVIFAMLALVILFATILNQVGGYTVMQNTVDPATLADRPLDQLGPDQLAKIINDNLTSGQVDRLITNTLAQLSPAGLDSLIAKVLAAPDLAALAGKPTDSLTSDDLVKLLSDNLSSEAFDAIRQANAPALDQLSKEQLLKVAAETVLQPTSEQQLSATPLEGLSIDELTQVVNDHFGPRRLALLSNPDWSQLPVDQLLSLIRNELLPAPDASALAGQPIESLSEQELLLLLNESLGLKQLEQLSAGALNQVPVSVLKTIAERELLKPVDATSLSDRPLNQLSAPELVATFRKKLAAGNFNHFTALTLAQSGKQALIQIINVEILQPGVKESWGLFYSLFNRNMIEAEINAKYPGAKPEFRWWLNGSFLTTVMNSRPELSGIRTALLGSLWMIALTVAIAVPIGTCAAIYLEEFAGKSLISKIIQINIYNLAGVPSIIYGMLGLAIFVRGLEQFTSGAMFGVTDASGRTILSAALTMTLLILPLIIINTQEAIRAVPTGLREAAYGIGLTKLETIWHHVLPAALPGMLTGTILAMSRAIGETAPLIVIGASTFIAVDPSGPFSKFTVLPIQIYKWASLPDETFRNIAAAAIVVLLGLLITFNLTAILLRNRFRREN